MNWQRFCIDEHARWDIDKPFRLSGWHYATDGRIAVRAPTDKPDTAANIPPTVLQMFGEVEWSQCTKPLPEPHPDRHEFEDECGCLSPDPYSDDLHAQRDCKSCNGSGVEHRREHVWLRFDGMLVDGKYLAMIHEELALPAFYAKRPPMTGLKPNQIPIVCGPYQVLLAQCMDRPGHWTKRDACEASTPKGE